MSHSRRTFLRNTAVATAATALPLGHLFSRTARAEGVGPLVRDPAGVLDLPAGFSYRILERTHDPMDDGYRVPGKPDGMACFLGPDGTLVLMRNHELDGNDANRSAYHVGQPAPPEAYNRAAYGAVTRLVLDSHTFERRSSNLVLTGTMRNCAGGLSPWGWLSCEESVSRGHGYVFLCPTSAASVREPARIPAYGRFYHEAATVDPTTLICYLTEDRIDGCLYRFVPDDPARPFEGRLQALRVVGQPATHTSNDVSVGDRFDVDWVDIDEPDPADDSMRQRARGAGAAMFSRGEGIWLHDGRVYICCTSGGPIGGGQIFSLTPDGDGGELELLAHSTDPSVLDMPDNITVTPWGDVYIAEDGHGAQYLRVLTPAGAIADFARNAASNRELAGVCFSPDSRALFVNLQHDGLTLVVTGPFPRQWPDPPAADGGRGGCGRR